MVRTHGDDESEQRVIDDVKEYGWHIVGIGEDSEGPAFAYSIGLYHSFKHPEVILFGLKDHDTMVSVINRIGELVREGQAFDDWQESDQILTNYSCVFRTVPSDWYAEYLGYAMWFYRSNSFPVLQCIWPDGNHKYPWHSDCAPNVRSRQTILAKETGWPFLDAKNVAVFTTKQVLDGSHPILRVTHDEDGAWQFLCGTTNAVKHGKIVALETIVSLHPSLTELADLPLGWKATRATAEAAWERKVHS